MNAGWWRRRRSDDDNPGQALARPAGTLTAEQSAVWDVLQTWRPRGTDPAAVLALLDRMCEDDGTGRPTLRLLATAHREGRRIRVYAGVAGTDGAVPPFLLMAESDRQAPAEAVDLEVVTADLGPGFLDQPDRTSDHYGSSAIVYPVPAPLERQETGSEDGVRYKMWRLEGTEPGLSTVLRETIDAVEPAELTLTLARFVLRAREHQEPSAQPVPGVPVPEPEPEPFPEPADPGRPPPLLPARHPRSTTPARPAPRHAPVPPDARFDDPALDGLSALLASADAEATAGDAAPADGPKPSSLFTGGDRAGVRRWPARLVAELPPEWSAVRLLHLEAGRRVSVRDGSRALLLEDGACYLCAALLDVRSLPAAGASHPPLSRLRMLHERLLPAPELVTAVTRWSTLLGAPAVLDELDARATGWPAAFSLAADTGLPASSGTGAARGHDPPTLLAVVAGTAPEPRRGVLAHAEQIGAVLRQPPGPVGTALPTWVAPRGWTAVEELQLSTETLLVRVRLEPLQAQGTLDDWEAEVFARAPFLRDRRTLGWRAVQVAGLAAARLHRFDWQPSGRGRQLSNVCVGVTDGPEPRGFSLVAEGGLGDAELEQPDAFLRWIRVLGAGQPTGSTPVC